MERPPINQDHSFSIVIPDERHHIKEESCSGAMGAELVFHEDNDFHAVDTVIFEEKQFLSSDQIKSDYLADEYTRSVNRQIRKRRKPDIVDLGFPHELRAKKQQ